MLLKIKKGIDLKLTGTIPPGTSAVTADVTEVALIPDDFPGLLPKPEVKPGDKIVAGAPLWHDKTDTDIKVVSPVAGTVKEIVRGEKRKILRIVVEKDKDAKSLQYNAGASSADDIKRVLKESGLWAQMRQLPYDIVPADNRKPVNIFISAWDAAPLSPGFSYYLTPERIADIKAGVAALAKLTTGTVFIGSEAGDDFPEIPSSQKVEIEGSYPASLPSVLAANIAPVNKGETVWLLSIETAARLGQALQGKDVDWTFPVAVVGSEIEKPAVVTAPAGAPLKEIFKACPLKCCDHHVRIISGNVLVGNKTGEDGYLGFPYRQLTAIPEGDDRTEFMGWASVSTKKISTSRSFPSFFLSKKRFTPDARLNGGHRAIIMSGEYDRYIPMDIMGEYLIKAILAKNIERMEALGIYEVTPGDFSAAEYADTSKLELQKIVREGLDYMIKEVGID